MGPPVPLERVPLDLSSLAPTSISEAYGAYETAKVRTSRRPHYYCQQGCFGGLPQEGGLITLQVA